MGSRFRELRPRPSPPEALPTHWRGYPFHHPINCFITLCLTCVATTQLYVRFFLNQIYNTSRLHSYSSACKYCTPSISTQCECLITLIIYFNKLTSSLQYSVIIDFKCLIKNAKITILFIPQVA